MNMLGALLNHWANDPLQHTLVTLSVSLSIADSDSRVPVWSVIRRALQTVHLPAVGRRPRGLHGGMV